MSNFPNSREKLKLTKSMISSSDSLNLKWMKKKRENILAIVMLAAEKSLENVKLVKRWKKFIILTASYVAHVDVLSRRKNSTMLMVPYTVKKITW